MAIRSGVRNPFCRDVADHTLQDYGTVLDIDTDWIVVQIDPGVMFQVGQYGLDSISMRIGRHIALLNSELRGRCSMKQTNLS
jgi:hypothetical protein